MQIFGSKFRISSAPEFRHFFNMSKNLKKLTLNGLRNGQSVTYSKMQTKVCRGPWGAPMDWCLMKSVNAEYPLSCRKCVEKPPKSGTFGFEAPPEPPSVSHPLKMVPPYSPAICPPKTPKPRERVAAPSSRKKWFSEGPIFWHKYSNGSGVAKKWHISNLTKKDPRTCHKLSWAQIWEKNSNGKCPKWAIRDSHSLRYKVV